MIVGYGALATVLSGWTGTVTVAGVATSPETYDSAASLLARVVERMRFYGTTLTLSVSSSGVITITSASAVTISFSGNCGTRTGFTAGPYTSVASATGASAYTGAYVPTYGLRLDGPLFATRDGAEVASGAYAAAPARAWGEATLQAVDTFAGAWGAEDDDPIVVDYWHDGRVIGRGLRGAYSRKRRGLGVANPSLSCAFAEVTE